MFGVFFLVCEFQKKKTNKNFYPAVFPSSLCSPSRRPSASASPNLRTPWRPAADRKGRARSDASGNDDLSIGRRSSPVACTSADGCRIAALREGARTRGLFADGVRARAATDARPARPFVYKGPRTCRGGVDVDEGDPRPRVTDRGGGGRKTEPVPRAHCTLYILRRRNTPPDRRTRISHTCVYVGKNERAEENAHHFFGRPRAHARQKRRRPRINHPATIR